MCRRIQALSVAIVLLVLVATFVHGRFVPDTDSRLKRTSSDQRIAELQALIAMSRGGALVGHGQVDPYEIGKRKRDVNLGDSISDIQRFRILREIFKNAEDRS